MLQLWQSVTQRSREPSISINAVPRADKTKVRGRDDDLLPPRSATRKTMMTNKHAASASAAAATALDADHHCDTRKANYLRRRDAYRTQCAAQTNALPGSPVLLGKAINHR